MQNARNFKRPRPQYLRSVALNGAVLFLLLPGLNLQAQARQVAPPNSATGQAPAPSNIPEPNIPAADIANPPEPPRRVDLGAELQPLQSGNGILIGDPVCENVHGASFGAGCTRWLYDVLSSQPSLGKTVGWPDISNYVNEGTRRNWQLKPESVTEVGRFTGVTHIVTAQFEGAWDMRGYSIPDDAPGNVALTLTLHDAKTGAAQGEPIRLEGTAAQIVAALPDAARRLATAVGVTNPVIPQAIQETPSQLSLVGRQPLDLTAIQTEPVKQLRALATSTAWVQAWSLRHSILGAQPPAAIHDASAVSPSALQLVLEFRPDLAPLCQARIHQLATQTPNNYLIASLQRQFAALTNDISQSEEVTKRSLRCSLANPFAWYNMARIYSDQAEAIRRDRLSADITEAEWNRITPLYYRWEAAANRAARLNPEAALAWKELATAATFAGDEELAIAAIWKARTLKPGLPTTIRWGLQMSQPKWFDRADLRLKFLEDAVAENRPLKVNDLITDHIGFLVSNPQGEPIIQAGYRRLFTRDGGWFDRRFVKSRTQATALWEATQANPQDAARWKALEDFLNGTASDTRVGRPGAQLSHDESRFLNALYNYAQYAVQRQIQLNPKDGRAWVSLAQALYLSGADRDIADEALAKAQEYAPQDPRVTAVTLNYTSPNWGADKEKAFEVIRRVHKDPELFKAFAIEIAQNLTDLKRFGSLKPQDQQIQQQALTELANVDLTTAPPAYLKRLVNYYRRQRELPRTPEKFQDGPALQVLPDTPEVVLPSVAAASQWTQRFPEDIEARLLLAKSLDKNHGLVRAVAQYREVLKLDPRHAEANLAVGKFHANQREYAEAEKLIRQAIVTMPYWQECHLELAKVLNYQKRFSDAIFELQLVLKAGEAMENQNPYVKSANELLPEYVAKMEKATQQ